MTGRGGRRASAGPHPASLEWSTSTAVHRLGRSHHGRRVASTRAAPAHLGAADSAGCPWHGWELELTTGRSVIDPRDARVRAYPARVEDGSIVVDVPG